MTGPSAVTPTEQRPDYDVTVTDGTNTLGFLVINPSTGKPDPKQLQRRPLARTAIKTSVGESAYSDFELPWTSIVQTDWSGGRGSKTFEDDKSKFYDSYRVLTDTEGQITLGPAVATSKSGTSGFYRFFEYKRCIYGINVIDGSNSILHRNGYLGAADSNSGALTTLVDATRTWTVDALIGGVCILLEGPGSEESQPWRAITDNDATSITVSPAWNVTHTTSTVYAIINVDIWTQVLDLGGHVTDVAVADEFVYFARGETASLNVLRYNEYNLSGVWTERNAAETMEATYLQAIRNETDNVTYLYGARNSQDPYRTTVWKMRVPPKWGSLYQHKATIDPTNQPWADRIITNATQSTSDGNTKVALAAGFTTGVAAVKNLSTPVDFTAGNAIAFLAKSDVAHIVSHWTIIWDDTEDLGRKEFSPTQCMTMNPIGDPHAIALFECGDGDTSTFNYIPAGYYIYVGYTTMFDAININLDATINNDTASVMAAQYYNGEWASLTISDGTASGGKTLAQDGAITFTHPQDWLTTSVEDNDVYWVRLKPGTDIYPLVKMYQITVKDTAKYWSPQLATYSDSGSFTDKPEFADGDTGTNNTIPLETADYLYICGTIRFDELHIDVGTANTTASVLSAEYYNGNLWTAVAGLSDGTANTGVTLAQDGSVTWTMPTSWETVVIAGEDGNTTAYYVIRFKVSVNIDAGTTILNTKYKNNDSDHYTDPYALYAIHTANAEDYSTLPCTIDGNASTSNSVVLENGAPTYLYIGSTSLFNEMYFDVAVANTTVTSMAAQYFNGSQWTAITILDYCIGGGSGAAFETDGIISFIPQNDWTQVSINNENLYWIRLYPLTGNVYTEFNEIRLKREKNTIENFNTALVANEAAWQCIAITPTKYPFPNDSTVSSIGIRLTNDSGAENIQLIDGMHLVYTYADQTDIRIPTSGKITGLATYSGDETGGVANPWVYTEDGIYEVQTQNNDAVVKLPLGELKELKSENTGVAWCTNGVYLVFSLGMDDLQRYYNKNLDRVGPNEGEGLPSNRRGSVSALLSMPGKIIVAIDGNTANYSNIMSLDGSSWHDIYYPSAANKRIRSLINQVIPGQTDSKIFFSEGVDIKWFYYSPNPFNDSGMVYAGEGYLITSYMYAGMMDVVKAFKSLKVFGENLDSTSYVEASYRVDGDSSWTAITDGDGDFNTEPSEELNFSTATPPTVTGKRIQLKLTLKTSDTSITPRVLATLVEAYGIVPVKYDITFPTLLADGYVASTLQTASDTAWGYSTAVNTALTVLTGWVDDATPLTLNSRWAVYNNRTVVAQSPTIVPFETTMEQKSGQEQHICQLTFHDL